MRILATIGEILTSPSLLGVAYYYYSALRNFKEDLKFPQFLILVKFDFIFLLSILIKEIIFIEYKIYERLSTQQLA